VHMHLCVYVCACVSVMKVDNLRSASSCAFVCMCIDMCVCVYLCMYMLVCVCACVCVRLTICLCWSGVMGSEVGGRRRR
jgi:hypothetical protein